MIKKGWVVLTGAVVLVVAFLTAIVLLSFAAVDHVRGEYRRSLARHLELLASKSLLLLQKGDTAGMRSLLVSYVQGENPIEYAFIESGGLPYAHSFGTSFPMQLIDLKRQITRQPSFAEVNLPGGDAVYDIAMLVGLGSATIHMGVAVSRVDEFAAQSTALPFALIGLSALIIGAITLVELFRRFAPARPIRVAAPERRAATESATNDHWSAIMDNLPEGVFIVDTALNQIRFANKTAVRMIGFSRTRIQGKPLGSFLDGSIPDDAPLTDVLDEPHEHRAYLRIAGGSRLPVARFTGTVNMGDRKLGLITFFDMSELKDLEERLRQAYQQQESLANYDKLTRLFNRHAIQKHFEAELNRADRGSVLGVALIDIDLFKQVNDRFGHQSGDVVLRRVAEVIKGNIRPYDWLGRWGGEEFVLILPGTYLDGAAHVAERVRAAVAGLKIPLKGYQDISVTISIGVTCTSADSGASTIIETLVQQSDDALYRAKESGRNRTCLWRKGHIQMVDEEPVSEA